MTHTIVGSCCVDASCVPACPVQCIRPREGEADFSTAEQLHIDPATCIDCGACVEACPVDAAKSEFDLEPSERVYLDINAQYFARRPLTDTRLPAVTTRQLPEGVRFLNVAIVGAGAAGCYAADLLSKIEGVTVSMFDRLATPFGLVRTGVAPDHLQTKQISTDFDKILSRPSVRCYFNVEIGRDLSLAELLDSHHAVIYACGVNDEALDLGIPGESLQGSVSARDVVCWYNGDMISGGKGFDLSGARAVVIGNGNVALDVARVFASPWERFLGTDISEAALSSLRDSRIRDVVVVGRKGPRHAAYTTSELLGLASLEGVHLRFDDRDRMSGADGGEGSHDDFPWLRQARILDSARRSGEHAGRTITLRYFLAPKSINGDARVSSITFGRNEPVGGPDGSLTRATGATEILSASLVVRAVGSRGTAIQGVSVDPRTGTIPHERGRVKTASNGVIRERLYCAGWVKRGPTGGIGANRSCAAETVDSLLADVALGKLERLPTGIQASAAQLVEQRRLAVVDYGIWKKIDAAECQIGATQGRTRAKFADAQDALAFCATELSHAPGVAGADVAAP